MRVLSAALVSALCAGAWLLPGCGDDGDGAGTATGGMGALSGGSGGTGGASTATGGATSANGGASAKGGATSGATGGRSMAGAPNGGKASGGGTATGGSGGKANGSGGASTAGSSGAGNPTPSSGCDKSGAMTGVQSSQEIEIEGQARTYLLSVPMDYQANQPYPLVFAWHGLGGSGMLARQYFRIEQQAKSGAIFVYPDGLENDEGNAGWDLSPDGVDVALFDALLDKVSADYCVDENRVFSTGHSFGGFFTERLGCSRAEALRAIAPVAGGPPFGGSTNCSASVAAWITHGSNDATVDFETGEAGRDLWLETNGCGMETEPASPEPCVSYTGCTEPVHWCVHDQNHDWPDFAAAGIWAFFSALK